MPVFRASCIVLRLAVSLCAGMVTIRAANPATTIGTPRNGYSIRIWQTEDGLPHNTVTSIKQTRDGYLWIGTLGGLARFDGVRFQIFNSINTPELADSRILTLHEDREGVLWIGHYSPLVTQYRSGRFQRFDGNPALVADRVNSINSDATGRVWLLHESGILEPVGGGDIIPVQNQSPRPSIVSLVPGAAGDLHTKVSIGDPDTRVSRLSGGRLMPIDFGSFQRSGSIMALGPGQKDGIWVVRDSRMQKWNGPRLIEDRGPCPWGDDVTLATLLELRNGCLAAGSRESGLYLCLPDKTTIHFDQSNGLPLNRVRCMYEDREGNLWLGIGAAGLIELVPAPFSAINPPDQWQGFTALCIAAARDGALWIGTEGAGLYRYQDGDWTHFGPDLGINPHLMGPVAEDPHGQIWAGTWRKGVLRLQNGRLDCAPEYDPKNGPVLAIHFAPDDSVPWIGSRNGLFRWPDPNEAAQACTLKFGDGEVCSIAHDRAGVVWFGISQGGLGRLEGGQLRIYRRSDGLSSDSVQCLLADDDGTLWIGTSDGGLNRLKEGRFSTIDAGRGLACNTICNIVDDGLGFLWMSTNHGIMRLARAELNACADGRVATVSGHVFDRSDGLPTLAFSSGMGVTGCRSADGRLWFTSSKGVVSVDPASIRLNPVPPPVVLESLCIDGRLIEPGSDAMPGLRLRPDHRRIEFQYTALSLTAPDKVMFKYRLEGIDEGWIEAGTKRSVAYSRLPAGQYVFHVIARNNDGLWNTAGASLGFTVLPFLWQTWWIRGLSGLAVVSAVGLSVRYMTRRRMQRRIEELERDRAIERERTRISQDMHDDVGASLTRITMLSQCVTRDSNQPVQTAAVLDGICESAREATRALDEIVWAVSPRHDSLDSLIGYMGAYAQELLGTAGIRCRLDLPLELPALPLTAEIRHHLFMAFKEVLSNTLKHASATEVHVSLTLRPGTFVLTITDNGLGFESSATPSSTPGRMASGNGLTNLQHRLAEIGGRCEIASRAGAGTQVSFIVGIPDTGPIPPSCLPQRNGQSPHSPPPAS